MLPDLIKIHPKLRRLAVYLFLFIMTQNLYSNPSQTGRINNDKPFLSTPLRLS